MIKTIELGENGEKKISFSTNFAWCFIYKSQFGEDPERLIMPLAKAALADPTGKGELSGEQIFDALGFTGVVNIAWSMAKLADKSIPEPMQWVQDLGDDFDMMKLVQELLSDAIISCFTSKKSKVPIPTETKKKAPKKSA